MSWTSLFVSNLSREASREYGMAQKNCSIKALPAICTRFAFDVLSDSFLGLVDRLLSIRLCWLLNFTSWWHRHFEFAIGVLFGLIQHLA